MGSKLLKISALPTSHPSDLPLLQVQGRVLVPAAAMLEASRAAAQQLFDDSKIVSGSNSVALVSASIPAPLVLPAGSSTTGAAAALPVVRCSIAFGGSAAPMVQLQSRGSSSSAASTNLRAELCSHVQLAAPAGTSQPSSFSRAASQLVFLNTTAAAAPAPLVACGGMAQEAEHAGPGYQCHPAALDATLHLGVFAVPHQQQDSNSPAAPRVPVAAAYFHAPLQGTTAASSTAWPLLRCDAATADSTTSSYALLSGGVSGGAAFQLHQLQSRALRSSSSATQKEATSAAASLATYTVQYAAHSAAVCGGRLAGAHAAVSLAGSAGRLALLRHPRIQAAPAVFGAAQKALRRLQQEGSSVSLAAITATAYTAAPAGAQHQHNSSTIAASALQGMLKAAAAEAAATAQLPGYVSRSYLQPTAPVRGAADGDVFAAPHLEGGSWQLPQLTSGAQQLEAEPLPAELAGSNVAISGGMGALGLLIASWLSAQAGSSGSTSLWGRSAAARLPTSLVSSGCLITAAQCDAAVASDMSAAADRQCSITAYIHAGELLVVVVAGHMLSCLIILLD